MTGFLGYLFLGLVYIVILYAVDRKILPFMKEHFPKWQESFNVFTVSVGIVFLFLNLSVLYRFAIDPLALEKVEVMALKPIMEEAKYCMSNNMTPEFNFQCKDYSRYENVSFLFKYDHPTVCRETLNLSYVK